MEQHCTTIDTQGTKTYLGVWRTTTGVQKDLWREGYVLDSQQLPPMVTSELATKILRCGKSIIFLRESCADSTWVPRGAMTNATNLEYGQVGEPAHKAIPACLNPLCCSRPLVPPIQAMGLPKGLGLLAVL